MKVCSTCKKDKDESEYHLNRSRKDGLSDCCKKCKREYSKKFRKLNPDKILKYRQKYGAEYFRNKAMESYWRNREKLNIRRSFRRKIDKIRENSKQKVYSKRFYQRHRTFLLEKSKLYIKNNPEQHNNYRKSAINKCKDSYLKQILNQSGIGKEDVAKYPILIPLAKLLIKTKRELKKRTS